MDPNTAVDLERPSDLTIGDVPDGVDRRALLTRSAVAGPVALTAKEMNRKCKETAAGGLAVSLVRC
jgi:hypothetical protein